MIHFAYAHWYWVALPIFLGIILYRFMWYKPIVYKYSLAGWLQKKSRVSRFPQYLLYMLRFSLLALLLFLLGKPQLVDKKNTVSTEGIDIMIALDASGSMRFFDDVHDRRSRFAIAQQEAINFVQNRVNDQLGLVLFGQQAIARCPLTLDHIMLERLIRDFTFSDYGQEFQNGTACGQALVSCARRLQKSKAKSKVVVLLTDGIPTDPQVIAPALKILKKFDIKVYTIAIGRPDNTTYFDHPQHGIVQLQTEGVNLQLLSHIAEQTGGMMFQAHRAEELKQAYQTIDTLEKTAQESDIYQQYTDYFKPFLLSAVSIACIEFFLKSFVWCIV